MTLSDLLPAGLVSAAVRVGAVPATLDGGTELNEWLVARDDAALYRMAGFRMLVRGTHEVVVEPLGTTSLDEVAVHVYGMAVRSLLLHGGVFCLHASAVRLGGTVLAVGGRSGAGKSTTAMALAAHGELLVDDVVPVTVTDGVALVHPFHRPVHLDRSPSHGDAGGGGRITSGPRGKQAVEPGAADRRPCPLQRLVVIELGPPGTAVSARPVGGAERLRWIVRLSNSTGLASLGRRAAGYFAWAAAVADAVPTAVVTRPDGSDTLGEVVAMIRDGRCDL